MLLGLRSENKSHSQVSTIKRDVSTVPLLPVEFNFEKEKYAGLLFLPAAEAQRSNSDKLCGTRPLKLHSSNSLIL